MNKLTEHLTLITEVINTGFPEVYNHLMSELDDVMGLEIIYQTKIISIFTNKDLVDECPEFATHIFDTFLQDGEMIVYILLIKFVQLMQSEIMGFKDDDLVEFMQKHMA
jgi:hypothetical protein